jgi:hypothetical protein
MVKKRYSQIDERVAFGFLANVLGSNNSGDGDINSPFPLSDAEDMSRGVHFIPGEVTFARRGGKKVIFVSKCGPCCWYWKMPDGTRIYHWDQNTYQAIGVANNRKTVVDEQGNHFKNGAGPCPRCGNKNTNGETVKP